MDHQFLLDSYDYTATIDDSEGVEEPLQAGEMLQPESPTTPNTSTAPLLVENMDYEFLIDSYDYSKLEENCFEVDYQAIIDDSEGVEQPDAMLEAVSTPLSLTTQDISGRPETDNNMGLPPPPRPVFSMQCVQEMEDRKIKEDTVLVILGASGDLARKKLERRNILPSKFRVVGFAPDELSDDEFNSIISGRAKTDSPRFAEKLKKFAACCSYVSGHEGGERSFQALKERLDALGENKKEQHRLFYMALPPSAFRSIEKPFGHDLESSRELQQALDRHWGEDEIFRIDHYLGKEVVNNLLVLRFGNEIFSSVWNRQHIENIEVIRTI
ncbi:MAG: hypothetical protein Q9167_000791 [Letrouitia subvulpina]